MTIGVLEVQAPAAVAMVHGLPLGPGGIGPVRQVLCADAVKGLVELFLADQERVVLRGGAVTG